jgi:glycosyltransferase involved in cell wall biosynthesis
MKRKTVALFYYTIVDDNAIGRCNRVVLERLCDKYDFTVFAVKFDNPRPDRIEWVRVRALDRPMFLSYFTFRIAAWFAWIGRIILKRRRFDLIVASDGCVDFAQLAHVHFCHRFYYRQFVRLRDLKTVRGFASTIDHIVRSVREGQLYRGTARVVAPSQGLRDELLDVYKLQPEHVSVIANPTDLTKYSPQPVERERKRRELGLTDKDFVCVFVALGHFERKGLGVMIDALSEPGMSRMRLLVVGGSPNSTSAYRKRAHERKVNDRVTFCGHHADTRPFLWAADAFALPSRYETFSIVATEAAACGIPVITTNLSGVCDWARSGVTGFVLPDSTAPAVADAVGALMAMSPVERKKLGENARNAVLPYGIEEYVKAFEEIYSQALSKSKARPATPNFYDPKSERPETTEGMRLD